MFKQVSDGTTPEMKALEKQVRRQIEGIHRAELKVLKIESDTKLRTMEEKGQGTKEAKMKVFNELAERHKVESDRVDKNQLADEKFKAELESKKALEVLGTNKLAMTKL